MHAWYCLIKVNFNFKILNPSLVCKVLAWDQPSIFTEKKRSKIELEDQSFKSAYQTCRTDMGCCCWKLKQLKWIPLIWLIHAQANKLMVTRIEKLNISTGRKKLYGVMVTCFEILNISTDRKILLWWTNSQPIALRMVNYVLTSSQLLFGLFPPVNKLVKSSIIIQV
jgi:hypothetical protein